MFWNHFRAPYSCLENSVDRGAWWATLHRVTKSWTGLSDWHLHFHLMCCDCFLFLPLLPRSCCWCPSHTFSAITVPEHTEIYSKEANHKSGYPVFLCFSCGSHNKGSCHAFYLHLCLLLYPGAEAGYPCGPACCGVPPLLRN